MTLGRQTIREPTNVASFRPRAVQQVAPARRLLSQPRQRSVTVTNSVAKSPFMLSTEQKDNYDRDGYLVIKNFTSADQLKDLQSRAVQLIEDFDPEQVSVFSTKNQTKTSTEYFNESANNISFFFEENAFDEHGELRQPKAVSINKIGHAMHGLDPTFRKWSRSSKIAEALADLGYQRPLPVQSMYICKQPNIGGEVVPHQDSTFLYTEPMSVVGFWMALEDSTLENGCLWTLPGSHKAGVRRKMTVKDGKTTFEPPTAEEYDLETFVPLEMKAGDMVILHGSNIHYSKENTSPKSRHAYSVHYVEGAEGYQWPEGNWLHRRSEFPFQPLTVGEAAAA